MGHTSFLLKPTLLLPYEAYINMKKPAINAPRLKSLRRALRRDQTPAETHLWQALRKRQLAGRKFKRQYSLGPYILDFYCAEERLAIELDGAPHYDVTRRAYDDERTQFLETQGIRVVRFENRDILQQRDVVLAAISWHLDIIKQA